MKDKIVTIWLRFFDYGDCRHNHISGGWDENQQIPESCTKQQKNAWKKLKWKKIKGELRNGKVYEFYE